MNLKSVEFYFEKDRKVIFREGDKEYKYRERDFIARSMLIAEKEISQNEIEAAALGAAKAEKMQLANAIQKNDSFSAKEKAARMDGISLNSLTEKYRPVIKNRLISAKAEAMGKNTFSHFIEGIRKDCLKYANIINNFK